MASFLKKGLDKFVKRFGTKSDRDLKRYAPRVDQINEIYASLESLSDEELQAKTDELRERLAAGETLDDLLPEAFAVVKDACRRNMGRSWDVTGSPKAWDMIPFDVQLIGAMALHEGNIAEMATGEGKTLVATLPLYLNGLTGKGAHLVTVNDYLARRDAAWVGGILRWLGLSVGCIQGGMSPAERREQYGCDVTYGTNNEFGFDYLRDNMAVRKEDRVQRPHAFAIVDEVDSVLIDEARTPLIISGPATQSLQQYALMKPHVEKLFRLQARTITTFLNEADEALEKWRADDDNDARYKAGQRLLQVSRGAPKHKRLAKLLADEPSLQKLIQEVEADYMREKSLPLLDEELYFAIDEKAHTVNISDIAQRATDRSLFRTPVLAERLDWIDQHADVSDEERGHVLSDLRTEYARKLIGNRNGALLRDADTLEAVGKIVDSFLESFTKVATSKPMSEIQLEEETSSLRLKSAEAIEGVVPEGESLKTLEDDENEDLLYDYAWKHNIGSRVLDVQQRAVLKEMIYRDYAVRAERIHNVQTLLKAYALYEKDVEYVVQEGRVIIVDQFTGRLMPGRRFSDGLHQALEAKEGLKIEGETQTLATITIQNYFRMYEKLAGMTGTAETEAAEFFDIYGLDVCVIPTNQPIAREDLNDLIYKTRREKYNAVIDEIVRLHELNLPVLVGTVSVEVSETLGRMLARKGIKHNVLNAKHHQKEAAIVADAGAPGGVTIATNMAGRGTDIKLSPDIGRTTLEEHGTPGGLQVIGTERHESRRIDRQLRGRSGRQGDPGASQFFISLEDNLMRLFAPERIAGMMEKLGAPEGEPLEHSMINKSIERAQKKVEARNFEIRKHLLEYDNVMNQQREIVYERRNFALEGEDTSEDVAEMMEDFVRDKVNAAIPEGVPASEIDLSGAFGELELAFLTAFHVEDYEDIKADPDAVTDQVLDKVRPMYAEKEETYGANIMREVERQVILRTIDEKWRDHLYEVDRLKEGISWVSVGGKNPLIEYKKESFELFIGFQEAIRDEIVKRLFRVQVQVEANRELEAPSGHAQKGAEFGAVDEVAPEAQGGDAAEIAERRRQQQSQLARMRQMALNAQAARTKRAVSAVMGDKSDQGGDGGDARVVAQKRPVGVIVGGTERDPSEPMGEIPKVGRNDPCPCGSGKKYKKCHGMS